jgi:hypothetical protein
MDPGHQVGYLSHPDDGRELVFFDKKMWSCEESKKWALKLDGGRFNILHPIGPFESAVGVPLALREDGPATTDTRISLTSKDDKVHRWSLAMPTAVLMEQYLLDQAAARTATTEIFGKEIKGGNSSLHIFWVNLQEKIVGEMFMRGRFKLLLILLGIAIVGALAMGGAAAYFASQERILCTTIAHINGTAYPVACPVIHQAANATSTATSTVSVRTVLPP